MTKATKNGKTENRIKELLEKPEETPAGQFEIPPPKLKVAAVRVFNATGSPYCQHRFGEKARQQLHDTHAEGKSSKSRKNREAKDFQANYESAKHTFCEEDGGGCGIPAASFRNAMIDACRLAGIAMTSARQAVFVLADGRGTDGTALVRIDGEPHYSELPVRNSSGVVDLRARPMWDKWSADLRIQYDADMLREADVAHLLVRAGLQVGIGEGRPFSKKSNGLGWGCFWVEGFEPKIDE